MAKSWRGFAVELVSLEGVEQFSFKRVSDAHYVALHDIVLNDGELCVDDSTPVRTRDLRDTITYLPAGCSVEGWSIPIDRQNSFTALYFEPSMLRDEVGKHYIDAVLQPVIYGRDGPLQATMRKFQTVFNDPSLESLLAESACLLAAVELLSFDGGNAVGRLSPRQMKTVIEYISDNLVRDISLSDLAEAAGLSRYHFGRAFKQTIGKSPYAFILERRVEAAADMIKSSGVSVEEIAKRCGFGNGANLRRKFTQMKGMTPAVFRRALQ